MRRYVIWLIAAIGLYFTTDGVRRLSGAALTASYIEANGVMLRTVADTSGSPPTLFFIHGYSESLFAWREVLEQLRQEYKIVAIDLPGFGLSAKPDSGYSVEALAAVVSDALRQLTSGPVVLIGNSIGAQIAATIAIEHPDLVEGLVLVDAAGLPNRVLSRIGDGRLSTEAVSRVFGVGAALSPTHDPRWLREADSMLVYQPSTDEAYYRALDQVLREFDFSSLDGRLAAVTQPTLVIWGRFDGTTPIENGRRFADEIPDTRFVVIEGALHRPHYTHPDQVAAEIRQFLLEFLEAGRR